MFGFRKKDPVGIIEAYRDAGVDGVIDVVVKHGQKLYDLDSVLIKMFKRGQYDGKDVEYSLLQMDKTLKRMGKALGVVSTSVKSASKVPEDTIAYRYIKSGIQKSFVNLSKYVGAIRIIIGDIDIVISKCDGGCYDELEKKLRFLSFSADVVRKKIIPSLTQKISFIIG